MKRSIVVLAVLTGAVMASLGTAARSAEMPTLPAFSGLNFHETPAALGASCDAAIASTKQAMEKILVTPANDVTFATLQSIETASAELNDLTTAQTSLNELAPDKSVRDASTDCGQKVSNYGVELAADPRIFAVAQHVAASGDAKTVADKKLVEDYVIAGRRSGAGLDAAKRKEVTALFQHINDLQRDFSLALAGDTSSIIIGAAEAKNLPADFLATLKKTGSGYVVPVNESTYNQFMLNEASGAARKRFYVAYATRGGLKNVTRLQEAVATRDRTAHILGYSSWAAYQLDAKMAKTPQRVENLLNEISTKLLPKAKTEVAVLAALKHKMGESGPFQLWDYVYYENKLVKSRYQVDDELVKQYFPIDHVISSILGIYQKLLGVSFAEIATPDAWAPGVREYSITDSASGKPIGWFYFDLYPRPGKFGHFANFGLRPGRVLSDGSFQKPVAAIIGNWPVAAPGKPALLSHDDVITFFHEFGHLMHFTLSTAPYETLYGTAVRPDFVEAPSQMLENFMWNPSILKEVSSNVSTGAQLPDDLIQKMIALKHVADGYQWSGQAFLAQYDMTIHSSGPNVNVDTTWGNLATKMTPLGYFPGTHREASFGHLMNGYDAGYYGYLWAKVYAQDIFTRFEREGLENPQVGMAYRKDILEPGAAEEPDVLMQRFLGRGLNYDAFYRDLGITR